MIVLIGASVAVAAAAALVFIAWRSEKPHREALKRLTDAELVALAASLEAGQVRLTNDRGAEVIKYDPGDSPSGRLELARLADGVKEALIDLCDGTSVTLRIS